MAGDRDGAAIAELAHTVAPRPVHVLVSAARPGLAVARLAGAATFPEPNAAFRRERA